MDPIPSDDSKRTKTLIDRRNAVFKLTEKSSEPSSTLAPATQPAADAQLPPAPYCGLALSGGGIRSATFSLGVLQAIALCKKTEAQEPSSYANSLLSCIDYLSTVSGGGYTGSFLASLFLPGRIAQSAPAGKAEEKIDVDTQARAQAERAHKVLSVDPPGRIHANAETPGSWEDFPLAWLRENGRYLTPTGPGDMTYDASLALRNWVAIHYVLGTVFVLAFASLSLLHFELSTWVAGLATWQFAPPVGKSFVWWWSPTIFLSLATFVLWACPTGLAYWWASQRSFFGVTFAALGALLLAVVLLAVLPSLAPHLAEATKSSWAGALVLLSLMWYGAAVIADAFAGANSAVTRRVTLTRWLAAGMSVTVTMAVVSLLEAAGQSLYSFYARAGSVGAVFSALGGAGALTLLVKRFVPLLTPSKGKKSLLSRIPLTTLAGIGGVFIIGCIAMIWSFAFAWALWSGDTPSAAFPNPWPLWLLVAGLGLLTGLFPGFINLSSLQTLYAARLTRAYLGASNPHRSHPAKGNKRALSAAEPVPGDDVELSAYCTARHEPVTLAPLHLINVTVNCTVDPAEQLVQRDRKGLPMAVCPTGYWIDGRRYDFSPDARNDIRSTPSVGKWVATSGAAVSTGIGRNTSLGLALLLGAANVRLGTWWDCPGVKTEASASNPVYRLSRFLLRTQAYLMDEFQAKFFGLQRDWQYLSDGGHFENLGLYELLRPGRQVGFVFAVDAGADNDYEFGDLAILIRLARIDFGIELEVDASAPAADGLSESFGTPEEFRAWAHERTRKPGSAKAGPAPQATAQFKKSAVLLKARRPGCAPHCWIVLFKPVVPSDAAADVIQYSLANPTFPQQTTADQFFDEAQWESYRKLGIDNAQRVLTPGVLAKLRAYTGAVAF